MIPVRIRLARAAAALLFAALAGNGNRIGGGDWQMAVAQTSQELHLPLVGRNYLWEMGAVSGKVIDATSGNPLIGVDICLIQGVCTQTDLLGGYSFEAYPGIWVLTARTDGYYAATRSGFVRPEEETTINFAMVPIITGENVALRVVLTWSTVPTFTNPITPTMPFNNDLDAHLWLDRPNDPLLSHHIHYDDVGDCTFYPNACLVATRMQGSGPEIIDISVIEVGAQYYYGIFNYNQGQPGVPPLIETLPHVDIYNQDGLIQSIDPPPNGGDGNFWYAFWMDSADSVIHATNCLAVYPAPYEFLFSPPCP